MEHERTVPCFAMVPCDSRNNYVSRLIEVRSKYDYAKACTSVARIERDEADPRRIIVGLCERRSMSTGF